MRLLWTVISAIFQFSLAYFLCMGAIFAGCAMGQSGYKLRPIDDRIISSSFYILPISCIIVLILIVRAHRAGGPGLNYLLNIAPFLLAAFYLFYARTFVRRWLTSATANSWKDR